MQPLQGFSTRGPWTNSIGKRQILQSLPDLLNQNSGAGPACCVFNKPSRQRGCAMKMENIDYFYGRYVAHLALVQGNLIPMYGVKSTCRFNPPTTTTHITSEPFKDHVIVLSFLSLLFLSPRHVHWGQPQGQRRVVGPRLWFQNATHYFQDLGNRGQGLRAPSSR